MAAARLAAVGEAEGREVAPKAEATPGWGGGMLAVAARSATAVARAEGAKGWVTVLCTEGVAALVVAAEMVEATTAAAAARAEAATVEETKVRVEVVRGQVAEDTEVAGRSGAREVVD